VGESVRSKLKIDFEIPSDAVIEGNDPVFSELAFSDGEGPFVEVDVGEIEVGELGDSEATGVEGMIAAVVSEPGEVSARVEGIEVDSVEVVAELALEDSGELFEREEVRDPRWVF